MTIAFTLPSATYTGTLSRVQTGAATYRIPHDCERVNVNAGDYRYRPNLGMSGRGPVRQVVLTTGVPRPEVFRMQPDFQTPIREAHQHLWKGINAELSGMKWRTLLGNTLAWTNATGFPGRRDWVNRLELDADKDPAFHAPIVDGGAIMEGEQVGERVYLKTLLISDPVPSAAAVLASHLWRFATSINPEGEINLIVRQGMDGTMKPVRVLTLTRERCWLPANELHRLPEGFLPDARWTAV